MLLTTAHVMRMRAAEIPALLQAQEPEAAAAEVVADT